jgi:hypothetical protein
MNRKIIIMSLMLAAASLASAYQATAAFTVVTSAHCIRGDGGYNGGCWGYTNQPGWVHVSTNGRGGARIYDTSLNSYVLRTDVYAWGGKPRAFVEVRNLTPGVVATVCFTTGTSYCVNI